MKKHICALLLMVWFFGNPGFGKSPGKEVLRVGVGNFPVNLNPVYVTDEVSQAIVNKVFQSLFYFDYRGKIRNGLVKDYRLGNSGRDISLELRKGIFFPGGKELTAADVVGTLELMKDPRFKYPYASTLSFIDRFERTGRYRLKLFIKEPWAPWRISLAFPILSKEEIRGADPGTFREQLLSGTGPYRIGEVKRPHKVVLELVDPSGRPALYPRIEYTVVSDTRLAPLKLYNREIDICEMQPEHMDAYRKFTKWRESFSILKYRKFGYTYLVFNLKNPRFSRETRNRFYNLLVCGDFINKFLSGRGEPVHSPFLYLPPPVTRGKLPVGEGSGAIRLKIMTNSESRVRRDLVLFLKQELKAHGIILEPVFLEYHTFLKYLKGSRFDLAVSGFMLDLDYDMKEIFSSRGLFNYAGLENPGMDELLDRGLVEMDEKKRESIYRATHDLWRRDLPLVPLFCLYYYMGVNRDIALPGEKYELVGSSGDFLFNIERWRRK